MIRAVSVLGATLLFTFAACTFGDLDGASGGANDAGPLHTIAGSEAGAADDASAATSDAGTSCTAIPDLLGHWTMDAADVQGTSVVDRSPAKKNGTIVGAMPSSTPGRFGEALAFPTDNPMHIALPPLGIGSVATVSLWAMRAGTNIDDVLVSLPWDGARYDLWWTNGDGSRLCFNTENNDCFGITDSGLRSRWVHIVAVFESGAETTDTLYVDGVKRTSSCVTSATYACDQSARTMEPLNLGGVDSFYFSGSLDDVRVFGRALSDAEVASLFAGSACP